MSAAVHGLAGSSCRAAMTRRIIRGCAAAPTTSFSRRTRSSSCTCAGYRAASPATTGCSARSLSVTVSTRSGRSVTSTSRLPRRTPASPWCSSAEAPAWLRWSASCAPHSHVTPSERSCSITACATSPTSTIASGSLSSKRPTPASVSCRCCQTSPRPATGRASPPTRSLTTCRALGDGPAGSAVPRRWSKPASRPSSAGAWHHAPHQPRGVHAGRRARHRLNV